MADPPPSKKRKRNTKIQGLGVEKIVHDITKPVEVDHPGSVQEQQEEALKPLKLMSDGLRAVHNSQARMKAAIVLDKIGDVLKIAPDGRILWSVGGKLF